MKIIFTFGHIMVFYKIAREAIRTQTHQSPTWKNITKNPPWHDCGYIDFDDIELLTRTVEDSGYIHVNIDTITAWAQGLKLKRLRKK